MIWVFYWNVQKNRYYKTINNKSIYKIGNNIILTPFDDNDKIFYISYQNKNQYLHKYICKMIDIDNNDIKIQKQLTNVFFFET